MIPRCVIEKPRSINIRASLASVADCMTRKAHARYFSVVMLQALLSHLSVEDRQSAYPMIPKKWLLCDRLGQIKATADTLSSELWRALCRTLSTIVFETSTPTTEAHRVATASVKLPRPQNKSNTRSVPLSSRRSMACTTIFRFIAALTCVKSVTAN